MTRERSGIFIEEAMAKAQVDAGRRYNGEKNQFVSRFILRPQLTKPIPQSDRSLELELTRKITKRSKRELLGLWHTLVTGSTVVRTYPTITVIKEPCVLEVKVRNSEIAKFTTKTERNTEL